MDAPFQIIDLFAGPGGLAEGFASVRSEDGTQPFKIALSIEKDPVAHKTLRFRSFLRQFPVFPDRYYEFLNDGIEEPDWASEFPAQWEKAESEAMLLELGAAGVGKDLEDRMAGILSSGSNETIVIGGPPCQAYSIVGRARNKRKAGYTPADDNRHFLYREYIAILKRVRPVAFVMENVKGILSSSVNGQAIFQQVISDLQAIGDGENAYELLAFARDDDGHLRLSPAADPRDFVIYAEDYGIPQARHRVIIIGVRRDALPPTVATWKGQPVLSRRAKPPPSDKVTVRDVLEGMPALRSGLSRGDSEPAWSAAMKEVIATVLSATASGDEAMQKVHDYLCEVEKDFSAGKRPVLRVDSVMGTVPERCPSALRSWLIDPRVERLPDHSSRGHMPADLGRYLFVSAFAAVHGRSPLAREFPAALAPKHKNWETGHFADRFRAQLWTAPSTTITSHIGKDGHYFIHPDPLQCRALTVREAARLQTFPDNYRFLGNQSQQFTQVGNAVPPLLARQIAESLHIFLTGDDTLIQGEPKGATEGVVAELKLDDHPTGDKPGPRRLVRKRTRARHRDDRRSKLKYRVRLNV